MKIKKNHHSFSPIVSEPLIASKKTENPGNSIRNRSPADRSYGKIKHWGFTLVELIVVITILVILGTIAFMSLGGYSSSARDSSRVSDLSNLKKSFELTYIKSGAYPTPSNGTAITFSGGVIWTQGSVGESVVNILNTAGFKLSKKPTDPKYPNIEYTYSLLSNKKEYQLGMISENPTAYLPSVIPGIISPVFAADSSIIAYVGGNYNGLIVTAQTGTTTVTTYYLALPSIILQNLSSSLYTELTNATTQSGNLVLMNMTNLPSTYTNDSIVPSSPIITYDVLSRSNQLTIGSGIVSYSTTGSLDSTGVTVLMNNLYAIYANSNIKSESTVASQVNSLVSGGSETSVLTSLYNGTIATSVNAPVVPIIVPEQPTIAFTATGGTITTYSTGGINYKVHTFKTVGSNTFTITSGGGDVEYLVVAGGGGGGFTGGGGGAGGMLKGTLANLAVATYPITVGGGGAGGLSSPQATNGSNSIFSSITAYGGGYGGRYGWHSGGSGGSGGGGYADYGGLASPSGQGNKGGDSIASPYNPAGGGGAGSAGPGGGTSGSAGVGLSSSISGSAVMYAGGGSTMGIAGGAGGGGAGGSCVGATGCPGVANTGGGGGAGAWNQNGGAGGSGIVIIRYPIS